MERLAAMRAAGGKCDGSIGWLGDGRAISGVAQEIDGKERFRAEPASALGSRIRKRAVMSPVAGKAREPVRKPRKIN
jgi:hypothetical protein